MVRSTKFDIVSHFQPADIDELADAILGRASERILDMAMERRLQTIKPRPLLNALARAERLGYDAADIVEEMPFHGAEQVIPAAVHAPSAAVREPNVLMTPIQSAPRTSLPARTSAFPQLQPNIPLPSREPRETGYPRNGMRGRPADDLECGRCGRDFAVESAFLHVSIVTDRG